MSHATASENAMPLSDMVVAMDIVDTLRHDIRMQEYALSEGERRQFAIDQVRKAYASQGVVVSDEIIMTAIDKMQEDELVHDPLEKGMNYFLAKLFVKRATVGKFASVILTAVLLVWGSISYYGYTSEQKQIEQQRYITDVLNPEFNSAVKRIQVLTSELTDIISPASQVEKQEILFAEAEKQNDLTGAKLAISKLQDVLTSLEQSKAAARLLQTADGLEMKLVNSVTDEYARAVLQDAFRFVKSAAGQGLEADFIKEVAKLTALYDYIMTPHRIEVVSRQGVPSGVERKHDQTNSKSWYIIVEAISPTGEAFPLDIKDRLYGQHKVTKTWGIRVPRDVYLAVGRDKKEDGVIDNALAGIKPAGKMDITWNFDVYPDETLNTW